MFLVFSISFAITFSMNKKAGSEEYDKSNNASLAIRNYGMGSADKIESIFLKYGIFIGVGLGIIIMALTYFIYGILALIKLTKFKLTTLILSLFSFGFLLVFGIELVFFENRYTALGNAAISFIGYPLMYTSIITVIFILTFMVLAIIKKDVKQ